MRHVRKRMMMTLVGVLMAGVLLAAPPEKEAESATETTSLATAKAALMTIMAEREAAFRELNDRSAAAALDQRVTLEAEAAELHRYFEAMYLESLVEYHRLSGNAMELERAERMLSALQAEPQTHVELPLDRNLTVDAPDIEDSREGVVQDEQ